MASVDAAYIIAETSDKITKLIEEDFAKYNESVVDRCSEEELVDDVGDYVVSWLRSRPDSKAVDTGVKTEVSYAYAKCAPPDAAILEEVKKLLPKGDSIDRILPHCVVIKTKRLAGYTAWLIRDSDVPDYEMPSDKAYEHGDYAVFRLTTWGHLRDETRQLGHCVGQKQMNYRRDLSRKGGDRFFSLRKGQHAVMTFQMRGGVLVQSEGKSGRRRGDLKPIELAVVVEWENQLRASCA